MAELKKLSITPDGGKRFSVMFNPNSYTITKAVTWHPLADVRANAPSLAFGGGGARELALELFFDSTESPPEKRDVRTETDQLVKLTRIQRDDKKQRPPPVCTIEWGGSDHKDFPFKGLVTSLSQRFTLFDESGQPMRAILNVTFMEFLSREDDLRKTDPELTTRTVRRGDSLASIAADVYGDAALWRVIALANRIADPFRLIAGIKLVLPKR